MLAGNAMVRTALTFPDRIIVERRTETLKHISGMKKEKNNLDLQYFEKSKHYQSVVAYSKVSSLEVFNKIVYFYL